MMLSVLKWLAILLVFAIVAFALWVRMAPQEVARWHVPLEPLPEGERSTAGSYAVMLDPADPAAALAALDRVALETERTERLAGSVEAGHVTYISRSRLFGFPDYITAQVVDGRLIVLSRLRFGQSDLGVNRARLRDWLSRAGLESG